MFFFYRPMREEETCDTWGPLGVMILERRIRTRRGSGHCVGPTAG